MQPLKLPLAQSPKAQPLDAEAAAARGLVQRREPSAQGLLDTFGRAHDYLRISVTERCNLRCRYCMPDEDQPVHARDHLLTFEEIERLARLFVRLGARKIRLTGGEPLVRRDIDELVRRIGALKGHGLEKLGITSNALLLREHLAALQAAGVDALNLSLDTLRPERFRAITQRDGCEETRAAILAAAAAGFAKIKVNCVVMKGVNDDELVDLARAFAGPLPIDVRYIEYMPFEGNDWGGALQMLPAADIRARLEEALELTPLGLDETATLYQARERGGAAFAGRLGVISSMTEPFCGTCNRTRITADGHFRWCLLDEGELDLRGPLRAGATDRDLERLIEDGLRHKRAGHAPSDVLTEGQRAKGPAGARSMIRIGG